MSATFRGIALLLAVLATGIVAGVLQLYSHTVMPGLHRLDDRTFVAAFQALDRAIVNPLFLLPFLGAFACTGAAALLSLGAGRRLLPWLLAALVLYLVVLVITFGINVPANDALKAAGNPDRIGDLAAVRARFDELHWARWNAVRAVAATAAFASLAWTLVLHGRLTAG
jgi:uncharacterized membrane protein